jgi:hypothetical protein
VQPVYDIQVAVAGRPVHCAFCAAFRPMLVQPAYDIQVAVAGRPVHCISRASTLTRVVLMQKAHDLQVTVVGCTVHRDGCEALDAVLYQPARECRVPLGPGQPPQVCARLAWGQMNTHLAPGSADLVRQDARGQRQKGQDGLHDVVGQGEPVDGHFGSHGALDNTDECILLTPVGGGN